MINIFVDTETSDLPAKGAYWKSDYKTYPRPVQIAWIITDDETTIAEHNFLIRPDGWKISDGAINIHGITEEQAHECGYALPAVLHLFFTDAKRADKVIGHNIYFDTSILKAAALYCGFNETEIIKALAKDKRFCTMKESGYQGKWPSLNELHKDLFNEDIKGAHDALIDIKATARCYFELTK